ncbi:MAG: SDR family NAD(P)-dependent oxidoreductase, partial [Candidatus Nanopelagicales bacterium]
MSDFQNQIAIVTGAASGIGFSCVKQLTEQGAQVFGFDLTPGDLDSIATFIECDITSQASVDAAFEKVSSQVDRIDILINNAGVGAIGTVEDATDEDWQRVFNVCVFGTARVTKKFLPLIRKSQNKAIINTGSVAAPVGIPKRAVYSSAKGAIQTLTLAMAADFVKEKIRVNSVNPGTADTPWVQRLLAQADDPQKERAALEARQPIGRLVSPDEVAHAILYLANLKSASTTGTLLSVD